MIINVTSLMMGAIFSAAAILAQADKSIAQETKIEPAHIRNLAEDISFNGVALIAHKGEIVDINSYRRTGMPQGDHTVGTRFNIGSIGKVFTAVAIGQLVDSGALKFEDHVRSYLSELPASYQDIKVSHLLTHMSGVGIFFQPKHREAIYSFETLDDIIAIILSEPQIFKPGERMQYSNSGFVILGALIERVSGVSYEDYIQMNIFDRAGMKETRFEVDAFTAKNYTQRAGQRPRTRSSSYSPDTTSPYIEGRTRRALPAGGTFSTALDMYKFARALMKHKLMSSETTVLMTSAKPGTTRKSPSSGKQVEYGYGFNVAKDGARIGHGGGGPGINAELRIWPKTQTVIITLANLDPPIASVLANSIEGYLNNQRFD